MRIPIRSESEAFRFTVAAALAVAVSLLVGWLSEPLVGVAIFVLAFAAGLVAYLRAPNPDRHTPLEEAARDARARGAASGSRHVLVVANAVLSGTELSDRIAAGGGPVEVDVLAPVLTSHLHYGVSDIDAELEDARMRLAASLTWARERGITARGNVGDQSPTTALADELRDFGADEVIVVTHRREDETWQERDEIERLRRELDVPVAHLAVGDAASQRSDG